MVPRAPADARRWDVLFAGATEVLFLFSADGHYLYASPNVGQLLGYASGELRGRSGVEDVHPDDLAVVRASHDRIVGVPGATGIARFRLRCKDGRYRSVEAAIANRLEDPDFGALVCNVHATAEIAQADASDGGRALRELAVTIVRARDAAEIARLACGVARTIPGVDVAALYVIEAATGDLALAHLDGDAPTLRAQTARFPRGSPRIAWLASIDPYHGRILELPAVGITGAETAADGIMALSELPLFHRGQLHGCLNIASRTYSSLAADVRATLEAIGAVCAKALAELAAVDAAREAARRHAELVATLDQGVLYQDATGLVTSANPALVAMLELAPERSLSEQLLALAVTREDGSPIPVAERPAALTLRTGEARRGDTVRVVTRSGVVRWLVIDTYPSLDDDHRVVGMHAVVTDVGERRRADEALRAKAAEYDALVHASHDGYLVIDAEARVLQVDDTFCVQVDRPREALLGTVALALVSPGTLPDALAGLAEARRSGFARAELDLVRPDGTALPVEASGWAVRASDHLVVAIRDLSRQRAAQAEIAEHERRYQSMVWGALDAFIVCDATGKILEVNDAASTIFGYPRERLLAMSMPELDATFASRAAAFGDATRSLRFETTARSGRGETLELEVNAWALGPEGPLLAFARDLTATRRAERALRASQEQLVQAQKMEAIGRLAGGVAHDFNNLLTVINSTTELAMEPLPPGDPLRDDLQEIANAGKRAAGLTRQLLTFSRRHVVEASVVDLDEVIADLERMLRRIIGEDIVLQVRRAERPALVFADRGQLDQVIVNLAVNARDAMPAGGTLRVTTTVRDLAPGELVAEAEAGPWVVVSVVDSGCGMDEATMARIFEPFFTTKGQAGTGLGLSTVYGIVKQSGGHVCVTSTVGSGTRFDVLLPFSSSPRVELQPPREPRTAPRANETILLVEDEPAVRNLVRTVLANAGYQVLPAAHGEEAIEICSAHPGDIHLLFTDLVMPRMNGREVAERVRAMRPQIKVIYSSGYSDDVLSRQGMNEPGVHFLQKPLSVGRMRSRVREVLDLA